MVNHHNVTEPISIDSTTKRSMPSACALPPEMKLFLNSSVTSRPWVFSIRQPMTTAMVDNVTCDLLRSRVHDVHVESFVHDGCHNVGSGGEKNIVINIGVERHCRALHADVEHGPSALRAGCRPLNPSLQSLSLAARPYSIALPR